MKYTAEMIMRMNGSEKMDTAYLRTLEKKDSFSRAELLAAIKESDLGEFVFDKLKEKHPGKVLIYPSIEIYHQYWYDDMIVIQKLISESPMGNGEKWYTRIEKMLVDIFADDIQKESFSESD
jgi:hypothetical protein